MVRAVDTLSGYTAMIPQVTMTASRPRCRTSRPASSTPAVLASVVSTRPVAIAAAVPVILESSAAGTMSKVIPGGWTRMNSLYGSSPCTSMTELPKYGPSSYSVTPIR